MEEGPRSPFESKSRRRDKEQSLGQPLLTNENQLEEQNRMKQQQDSIFAKMKQSSSSAKSSNKAKYNSAKDSSDSSEHHLSSGDELHRPPPTSTSASTSAKEQPQVRFSESAASSAKGEQPQRTKRGHVDFQAGRIYANNAPKILLETITARTALLIIAITYIVFILGFAFDVNTIYKSFSSSNYDISADSCSSYPPSYFYQESRWGCTNGFTWNSTVTELTNVLSVKLNVQQNNLTSILQNATVDAFDIQYDINLWACYNSEGCGVSYADGNDYTSNPNVWQRVLLLENQFVHVVLSEDVVTSSTNGPFISVELLGNTFQNQESIPTNGLVRSYHITVEYIQDPYYLFSGENEATQPYVVYTFDVVTRPSQPIVDGFTMVLIVATTVMLGWYLSVLWRQQFILTEQKWLVFYIFLVICFQNPIYCVVDWYKDGPPQGLAYSSYLVNYLAQSGLFILWLFFADSINRKNKTWYHFYLPKITIGLLIFVVGVVILTIQFPGLTPTTASKRNAVEAVTNWTHDLKMQFIVFTIMYLSLIMLWAIMWIVRLTLTGRVLKRLPYMSTRYVQLSYRFFFLQATLVTSYYLFQYAIVVYFISQGANNDIYDTTSITDNINTLLRQQTQLFGKTFFLTVYAAILTFLFLPHNVLESANAGLTTSLAATYVISEDEHDSIVKSRKHVLAKMKKTLLNQVTRMDQIVDAKLDVFCVDLALKMRDVTFQAYYDPAGMKTASSYDGVLDLDSIGFEFIDCFYDKVHEVFCFACREKKTNRLVIAFRGTASKRQMEDNLNYTKKPIDFYDLGISTLDHMDGLNYKDFDSSEDFELESVSDDEEDIVEDEEDDVESNNVEDDHHLKKSVSAGKRKPHGKDAETAPDTILDRAGDGITKALTATNQGINKVVGATTDLVVTAASKAPVLKDIVKPHVHSGFWDAYVAVRGFVHAIVRQELVKDPGVVYFTGHSYGGALATFASVDVTIHTIPRINAFLKHQAKLHVVWKNSVDITPGKILEKETSKRRWLPNFTVLSENNLRTSPVKRNNSNSGTESGPGAAWMRTPSFFGGGAPNTNKVANTLGDEDRVFIKRIKVRMYNFGSPRVGNASFAQLCDRLVPNSFRIVVDGDIVSGLPPSGYRHIGTEILIDSIGSGSIIIDPSFVERWLRTQLKSSVAVHSLLVYRKGLLGIKQAAEYMKQYATDSVLKSVDPIKVSMRLRQNLHQVQPPMDSNQVTASVLSSLPVDIERSASVASEDDTSHQTNTDIAMRDLSPDLNRKNISSELLDHGEVNNKIHELSPTEKLATIHREEEEVKVDQTVETKHYEKDVEQMHSLMQQIQTLKKPGAINWLKDRTVRKFTGKRTNSYHDRQVKDEDEEDYVIR